MRCRNPVSPVVFVVAGLTAVSLTACRNASRGSSSSNAAPSLPPVLESIDGSTANPLTSLDFGSAVAGSRVSRYARLRNPNTAGITVDVSGLESSGPFALVGVPSQLGAGESAVFESAFLPTIEGESAATATFTARGGPSASLALHGNAVALPCDAIAAASEEFGVVSIGASSVQALRIANPIDIGWTLQVGSLTGPDAQAFQLALDTPEVPVPASGEASLMIAFAPTRPGPHAASLSLTLPRACGSRTVALSGRGVKQLIECARDFSSAGEATTCALDFGYVDAPGERVARTLQFRNLGEHDLTLRFTTFEQPAGAPFALASGAVEYALPAGGDPVAVGFTFTPTAYGEQRASLTFTFDEEPVAKVDSIPLVGHAGGPRFGSTPEGALAFGKTIVAMPIAMTLYVTNTATPVDGVDQALRFAGLQDATWTPRPPEVVGSTDFVIDPLPPALLANGIPAGESAALTVHFAPTSDGNKSDMLRIHTNVKGGTDYDLLLDGKAFVAAPCTLEARPAAINFGTMEFGTPRTLNLDLVNTATSSEDVCIVSVAAPAPGSAYQLPLGAIDQHAMAAGETLRVPVQLLPRSTDGDITDAIAIAVSNPANPTISVPVTGTVQHSCLVLSQTEVDFHTVGPGCRSQEQFINIYNLCSHAITFHSLALGANSSSAFSMTTHPATTPIAIAIHARLQIGLTYQPPASGVDEGVVVVTSTDFPMGFVFPIRGNSDVGRTQTDVFALGPTAKRDVLMILDDSCSMSDHQANFARHVSEFFGTATAQNVDYQLGIVSPVVWQGPTPLPPPPLGEFARLAPTCGSSGPIIASPTSPTWPILGPCGPCWPSACYGAVTDAYLQIVLLALSRPLRTGWNAGLLRDDADLAVFAFTDADDPGTYGSTELYEDFFLSIKGRSRRDRFSFSAFTGKRPITDYSECSHDGGLGTTSPRLLTVVRDTDGVAEEICDTGLTDPWQRMSARVFGPALTYYLSSPPEPAIPLAITLDGQPFPATGSRGEVHWTYDATKNAVVFTEEAAPTAGSTFSISYSVKCL